MKQVESKVLTAEDKKVNKEFQKQAAFYRDCDTEIDKLCTRQGETLIEIRDLQLWKVLYKSMAEAVQHEFGLSWAECHKRIEDVSVINGIKTFPNGKVLLEELGVKRLHIRALAASADDDESRMKVLEYIRSNGLKMSEKSVKEVSDELLGPSNESKEDKAEKKRLELAERKRLAEEKRTAAAEQKRIESEKKAAEKLAAKEAKEAAKAEEKESAGRDQRTVFDPVKIEAQSTSDIVAIVECTKEGSAIVRLIQDACRRAKQFFEFENGAGSWMKLNSVIEHLDKAELEVKMSLFECECPRCKKKHSIKCELCGGRKFLDKRHANMLTDADKAALEAA